METNKINSHRISLHEAAHCLAGIAYGRRFDHVEISKEEERGCVVWDRQEVRDTIEDLIMIAAGSYAEIMAGYIQDFKVSAEKGSDFYYINLVIEKKYGMDNLITIHREMLAQGTSLLKRHWPKLQKISAALVQKKTLTYDEVLTLLNIESENLIKFEMGQPLITYSWPVLFGGKYFDLSFLYDGSISLQFTNQEFTSNITDWSSLSGSDRSSDAAFVWDASGGGSAFADGTSGSVQQTKYFAIERSVGHVNGWPPGTYTLDIVASNASDGTQAITPQLFGMMNGTSQTSLTATISPATVPDGGADTAVTYTFTTSQYWKYFALAFARSGAPGGFIMKVYIRSATITRAPVTEVTDLVLRQTYFANGVQQTTTNVDLSGADFSPGVYRAALDVTGLDNYDRVDVKVVSTVNAVEQTVTETKTILIDCECVKSKATGYYLTWMNHLGGFDYWYFNEYADHQIDITDSGETTENIFPDWPNSFGEFADTIRKQTFRTSREKKVIRSQNLTLAQLQSIERIKTSPLVQIVNSIYDRRTVLVDTDSFTSYREGQQEQYTITFTITYTDDIPSQSV